MTMTARTTVPHAVTDPRLIPAVRYHDPAFFELERERLWPHTWQMACRLEEVPDPGDFVEYRILEHSVVVVRVDRSTVKAFHNACRHRGVALVEGRGKLPLSGFVCPFHGWCYDLEGRNTFVYERELFDDDVLRPEDIGLRECRLDTWGGAVFVTLDDHAPPLRESLGPFASVLDRYNVEKMRTEWWFTVEVPANWKTAMEAFMEGFHTTETHPQLITGFAGKATYAGDGSHSSTSEFVEAQLSFLRNLSAGMGGMVHQKDVMVAEGLRGIELPEDADAAVDAWERRLAAEIRRWNDAAGIPIGDVEGIAADPVLRNQQVLFAFPNYWLLPTYGNASSYRFRPTGPETCRYELWSLTLFPEGREPAERPEPVEVPLGDPRWPQIPAQDFSNIPRQQRGLRTMGFDAMRLSSGIEGMISNYQRLIDGFLGQVDPEVLAAALPLVSGPNDSPLRDLGFPAPLPT